MYADNYSEAMNEAIKETQRRRKIQEEYNTLHNITPQTIIKSIKELPTTDETNGKTKTKLSKKDKAEMIIKLENEMREAAKNLDFEKAMELRNILFEIKGSK